MLATLGLGTAWLGGFALLAAPHRLFRLAAATVRLAGGAVLLWRRRSVVACARCDPHAPRNPRRHCDRPAHRVCAAVSRPPLCLRSAWLRSSTITCPTSGASKTETIPTDAFQHCHECTGCGTVLCLERGDCRVFCSYGTVPCPPMQPSGGENSRT